ncbi:MAG: hypothetical protein Q7R67_02595 [bacterium]|nr:hypothetical protein [bacterium]
MPDYSRLTEKELVSERQSTMIRLERERKELLEIDRALAAIRANKNGGEPKPADEAVVTER